MFARKVSLSSSSFGTGGGKATVSNMLSHVTKLMLKTLVEEVRFGTFSAAGLQQMQVDCGMLRWILPPCVEDEGSVVALLDEALISCQERCLDPTIIDHGRVEQICEAKRKEFAARFA